MFFINIHSNLNIFLCNPGPGPAQDWKTNPDPGPGWPGLEKSGPGQSLSMRDVFLLGYELPPGNYNIAKNRYFNIYHKVIKMIKYINKNVFKQFNKLYIGFLMNCEDEKK